MQSPARRIDFAAIVVATCIVAGVFFRLYHVDRKLYAFDETVTSLRATGHTLDEYTAFVRDGRTHAIGELRPFQAPSAATKPGAVWTSLAREDPQHPPLYYEIVSFVGRFAGDSVAIRRVPAVVFGLLALPAVWWMAFELFDSRRVAWCAAALVAVSPFQVAFAQQSREYSLWTLVTALASALLLRALRSGGARWWIAYAACAAIGLWGDTLFGLVLVAHALYVVLPSTPATPQRRMLGLGAIVVAVAAYAPWIAVLLHGRDTALADMPYSATRLSALLYAGKFAFNAGTLFFDLDYVRLALAPFAFAALAVAAWSVVRLVRRAPRAYGSSSRCSAASICSHSSFPISRRTRRAHSNRAI